MYINTPQTAVTHSITVQHVKIYLALLKHTALALQLQLVKKKETIVHYSIRFTPA